jgi:hypothetical protein
MLATTTWCLDHNRPEDQATLWGTVCEHCKQRLYTQSPRGRCRTFWESQPAAYSLDREPCFVYRIQWDNHCIRALHPPGAEFDLRSQSAPKELPFPDPIDLDPEVFWSGWNVDHRQEHDAQHDAAGGNTDSPSLPSDLEFESPAMGENDSRDDSTDGFVDDSDENLGESFGEDLTEP